MIKTNDGGVQIHAYMSRVCVCIFLKQKLNYQDH